MKKAMDKIATALVIFLLVVTPICLCLFSALQVVKYRRDSSFLTESLFYRPFISGTVISSETYNDNFLLKIKVKEVFRGTDGATGSMYSVYPDKELCVLTSEKSISEKVGSFGLFSLNSITKSVDSLDYVGFVVESLSNVLWVDDETGEVIYNPESLRALDRMSKEGVKLDAHTVGTVLLDICNKTYFYGFGIVLMPLYYFLIISFIGVYVVPFICDICGRIYKRFNIRKRAVSSQ